VFLSAERLRVRKRSCDAALRWQIFYRIGTVCVTGHAALGPFRDACSTGPDPHSGYSLGIPVVSEIDTSVGNFALAGVSEEVTRHYFVCRELQ
jgi:hypothetical protein